MNNELDEKLDFCSRTLIAWSLNEDKYKDHHNQDLMNEFIPRMIKKKFEVFNIDIVIPDPLYVILMIGLDGNPGITQVVLKDLLISISERLGHKVPRGYIITPIDFAKAFPTNFPIIDIPSVADEYNKKWDEQKAYNSDGSVYGNKCDIHAWWLEVVED